MIELKDVIHYYIGCDVIIDGEERGRLMGANPIPNSVDQVYWDIITEELKKENDDFYMPYNDDLDMGPLRIKPILKRVADMTNKEWESIRRLLSVGVLKEVPYKDKPYWVLVLENRINTNTMTLNDGLVLIKNHYDVFGLIDTNQAIDAKTIQNG